MPTKKRLSDKVIADAIVKESGLLTKVADTLGYTYQNIDIRIKKSEKLQQVLKETNERTIDIAESIIKKVLEGKKISGETPKIHTRLNTAWKYLRTKGKTRGYKEETDLNVHEIKRPDLPNDYRQLYKLKYGHYPEEEK